MKFIFPVFGAGWYYNDEGKLTQFSQYWPIVFARYVDAFCRLLVGKDVLGGHASIRTVVNYNGLTTVPKDQRITLTFVDVEHPNRAMWGSCLTAEAARKLAHDLAMMAEDIDPCWTLPENQAFMKAELARDPTVKFYLNEKTNRLEVYECNEEAIK